MQKALICLGYPTAHGFDMHANKPDCDMWAEAFNAKYFGDTSIKLDRDFWDKLLGHVAAVTDTPCNCFAKELMEAYPEAKIILVERDIDPWYVSFERALIQSLEVPGIVLMTRVIPGMKNMLAVGYGIMKGQFGARDTKEYRENAKPVYRRHYAEIRDLLTDQPGRLLEYKLGSGWKPLCDFLGKPIPDEEFPRVNESAMHDEMGRVVVVDMCRKTVAMLSIVAVPTFAVIAYFVWYR